MLKGYESRLKSVGSEKKDVDSSMIRDFNWKVIVQKS